MDYFTYISYNHYEFGEIVYIPFGKEKTYGCITINTDNNIYKGEKKFIINSTKIILNGKI